MNSLLRHEAKLPTYKGCVQYTSSRDTELFIYITVGEKQHKSRHIVALPLPGPIDLIFSMPGPINFHLWKGDGKQRKDREMESGNLI